MATKKINPSTKFKGETTEQKKLRMKKIIQLLKKTYPDAHCDLKFQNPYQLLISTILSAQCTDDRVNKTTPALFARFPDAKAAAEASTEELEALVRPTGFYRNKAKSIQECSRELVSKHAGQVPDTLEALTSLRGVGRKTANVVLGNAYGVPSFVVDTHVGRITKRLGFTRSEDAVKVEHEVREFVPKSEWTHFSHWLIRHGRAICSARTKPKCGECPLQPLCPMLLG